MNTGEMINKWFESGKTKEFEAVDEQRGTYRMVSKNENGQLSWNGENDFPLMIFEDEQWKEIRRTVTWEKARAWMEEKSRTNRVKNKSDGYFYYISVHGNLMNADLESIVYFKIKFLDDEWYILD